MFARSLQFAIATCVGGTGAAGALQPARPSVLAHAMSMLVSAHERATSTTSDLQVLTFVSRVAKALDFYVTVYERPGEIGADLFSEPLVRLDRNFQIHPAAAESWSANADGTRWTFDLRRDAIWSDGAPVTADDWVATFRFGADPSHGWDFAWYFQGVIKNWSEAITGQVPLDDLGVRADNPYVLTVATEAPAPYLPAMLLYSNPLSRAALAAHGPYYNNDPATSVSSGPFILQAWVPEQRIVLSRNERYAGGLNVPVDAVVIELAAADAYFAMYQNDEIDYMDNPAPADLALMTQDPATAGQIYSGVGDFPTWYIFFDVTKAPFTDKRVRQAWSHAIDRDALKAHVLGPNGIPAYSWLAPGFPASNQAGLKSIQAFDPDLARRLLAAAGYPGGANFPKQQMWLRDPSPLDKTVAEALGAMLKENLGIDVELLNRDQKTFMDALTAKPTEIPLGFVRYGMDFFDPYDMLSVWLSGGRHSWSNPAFDAKVKEAGSYLGPADERIKMFQEAERMLVEDAPAVFVYHGTPVQFVKPWVRGDFLQPDRNGVRAMHWPGYSTMSTVPAELEIVGGPARRLTTP